MKGDIVLNYIKRGSMNKIKIISTILATSILLSAISADADSATYSENISGNILEPTEALFPQSDDVQ